MLPSPSFLIKQMIYTCYKGKERKKEKKERKKVGKEGKKKKRKGKNPKRKKESSLNLGDLTSWFTCYNFIYMC